MATVIVPLVCLGPFIGKPFHMDDPTYLWPARHILEVPWDFYGFSANWYGFEAPMSQMNMNPPLVSYYIALAALLMGWSEVAIHLAFLVPAIGVSLGTYVLARRMCRRPHIAALAAVLTPVFVVSGTNVMCDMLMLAFFVWAVALWVEGLERDNVLCLGLSAVCASFSEMAKYFGMSLVPLLLAYSLARNRSLDRRLCFLAIPIIVLIAYEMLTYRLYGTGLLSDAASYATIAGQSEGWGSTTRLLTGLSFTGGCVAVAAFYAPVLWPRLYWGLGGLVLLLSFVVVAAMGTIGTLCVRDTDGMRWLPVLQSALFVAAGVHVMALAAADLWDRRDADSLLLFLWITGTFAFTTFLNWSTNGRTVLPMVPAAGILLMRRFDRTAEHREWVTIAPLIPAACLALIVSWADYSMAACQRLTANAIQREMRHYPHTIWFQGHWGFQYYMEAIGAKALDFSQPQVEEGDVVIVPSNNANKAEMPPDIFHLAAKRQCNPMGFVGTVQKHLGAGFYSDRWGPLPFAFGRMRPEEYDYFLAGSFDRPGDAVKRFREQLSRGR